MSEKQCGVRIVGVGVDGFHVIESEDDVQLVVSLMRKGAALQARPEVAPVVPEGMVLVSKDSVALAWRIAKERRDTTACAVYESEEAQRDLEALSAGGFDKHLPTLDELRGILKESREPQPRVQEKP